MSTKGILVIGAMGLAMLCQRSIRRLRGWRRDRPRRHERASQLSDDDVASNVPARASTNAAPRGYAAPALGPSTSPGPAIVTDIDATLTTSDSEWVTQMFLGTHDPAERPGGADLVNAYADRGYFILYLTARPSKYLLGLTLENSEDATRRWLEEHGYPVHPGRTRLALAPGIAVDPSSAIDYKTGVLRGFVGEGFEIDYAYGNAATDIAAYANVGIAKERTFIIGDEAGAKNTVPIDSDGWVEHTAEFLPRVAPLSAP